MGRILDLIFPKNIYCICCDDCIDDSRIHGLCDSCIEKMSWSFENRFRFIMDEFSFDDVLPCCLYGSYARSIIYKMKLQSKPYVARAVGKILADRVRLAKEEDDIHFDYIVPVPSTRKKERRRGYNQAKLMAVYTADELRKTEADILIKLKDTKSARLSTGIERRFMQEGVFSISEEYEGKLKGKHILLVDDVITTGSTANECARILKEAGAAWVGVLCFACAADV